MIILTNLLEKRAMKKMQYITVFSQKFVKIIILIIKPSYVISDVIPCHMTVTNFSMDQMPFCVRILLHRNNQLYLKFVEFLFLILRMDSSLNGILLFNMPNEDICLSINNCLIFLSLRSF